MRTLLSMAVMAACFMAAPVQASEGPEAARTWKDWLGAMQTAQVPRNDVQPAAPPPPKPVSSSDDC